MNNCICKMGSVGVVVVVVRCEESKEVLILYMESEKRKCLIFSFFF